MDGILNINKPAGITSYGVVAAVKRLTGERRVGHAGTLDPLAGGVLPICLGRGTRVQEFLSESHKVYRAEIGLGEETDTYDASGRVTRQGDPSGVSRSQLESALEPFRGLIQQTPPMYSALKHQGKRLYQLARAGVTVERQSRPAKIYRLELLDFKSPLVTLEVECGRGTYIRSLAYDIGRSLGCGAHLKGLLRLRYGCFDIDSAVSLAQFEDACRHGYWRQLVYSPDVALMHWPALVVADEKERYVSHGRLLHLDNDELPEEAVAAGRCRVYGQNGSFLAVMRFSIESGQWHPDKVFVG